MSDVNKSQTLRGIVCRPVGLSCYELKTFTPIIFKPSMQVLLSLHRIYPLESYNAAPSFARHVLSPRIPIMCCSPLPHTQFARHVLLPRIPIMFYRLAQRTATSQLSFVRPSHGSFHTTVSTLLPAISRTWSSLSAYSLQWDHARAIIPRFLNGLHYKNFSN